ncbi:glycosyltransferase [Pseudoalteromonas phenolica]|uniref:glycosyltransferase n=1 Tax=Pseudoalteromonas phenolica TaxID=161398 RepID=UPI00110ABFAA|nr:glycosyltransferase [Pseudoalteromonas phenolica]TMO54073.1 hypothetical protein CWC21_16715 [Pseudoalteromonas phenolica]
MDKIVINSVNTNSAGTSNITKLLISEGELDSNKVTLFVENNIHFTALNSSSVKLVDFGLGSLKRLFNKFKFELFTLQIKANRKQNKHLLVMANYSPLPVFFAKKTVIMRHPYLVDNQAWKEIKTKKHFLLEILRTATFKLTLFSTDRLIVQTEAMKLMLLKKYPNFKGQLKVINNPVPNYMLEERYNITIPIQERKKTLFYPSRYYAHKNHEVLLEIVKNNEELFKDKGLQIVITLKVGGEGQHILDQIDSLGLSDYFINLGEVSQNELITYYKSSLALLFPSNAETFGNSIAEAMCYGLPIFINDKPYSRSLCGQSAYYSKFESSKFQEELQTFLENWDELQKLSKCRSNKFLNSYDWLNEVLF